MILCRKQNKTKFYNEFISFFLEKEKLEDGTYKVVRYQFFDVSKLEDIERQKHLLNIKEILCLYILKSGVQISHFYFQDDLFGYITSIKPAHSTHEYSLNQFDKYTIGNGSKNIEWNKMYISVYKFINTYVILQHNEKLDNNILKYIQDIVNNVNKEFDNIASSYER